MLLLSYDDVFVAKLTFSNIISGKLSECQTVWIQIRTDVAFGKERVNEHTHF